ADVRSMRAKLPQFIANAADMKVMHDLMEGTIDKDTAIADRIATGRRDIALKAARMAHEITGGNADPILPSETKGGVAMGSVRSE
ncbi:unnamed protein product, partial [marine sediment metagenome]